MKVTVEYHRLSVTAVETLVFGTFSVAYNVKGKRYFEKPK